MFILLLILILSTGIFTYNAASVSIDTSRLEATEIQAFNQPIVQYEGRQMGSQVKVLLSTLISNAGMNQYDDDRLPDISYIEGEGPVVGESLCDIESDSFDINTTTISELRAKLENSHYYEIEFEYDASTGLIDEVIIYY